MAPFRTASNLSKAAGVEEKATNGTTHQQRPLQAKNDDERHFRISSAPSAPVPGPLLSSKNSTGRLADETPSLSSSSLRSPSTIFRPRPPPRRTTPYLRRNASSASKRSSSSNNISSSRSCSPWRRNEYDDDDSNSASIMAVLEPDAVTEEFVDDETTRGVGHYPRPFTKSNNSKDDARRQSPPPFPPPPPTKRPLPNAAAAYRLAYNDDRENQAPPGHDEDNDEQRVLATVAASPNNNIKNNTAFAQLYQEEDKDDDISLLHSLCQTARCVTDLQRAVAPGNNSNDNNSLIITVETAAYADNARNRQTALHVLSQNRTLAQATFAAAAAGTRQQQSSLAASSSLASSSSSSPTSSSSSSSTLKLALDRTASSGSNTTTKTKTSTSTNSSTSMLGGERHHDANVSTMATADEEQLTDFVVNVLWKAYPAAMMTTDIHGHIPFEGALRDWVDWTYSDDEASNRQQRRSNSSRSLVSGGGQQQILPNLWLAAPSIQTLKAAGNSVANSYHHFRNSKSTRTGLNDGSSSNNNNSSTIVPDIEQGRKKQIPRDRTFPSRVRMTAHALYAVKMLSAMLDAMEQSAITPITTTGMAAAAADSSSKFASGKRRQKNRRAQHRRQTMLDDLHSITVQDMSSSIVHSVASIPYLVKAILFIEDKQLRNQILGTSLLRRILICKYSVGSWLTGMLQSRQKKASDLAIEYLCLVSSASQDGDGDDYSTNYASKNDDDNSTRLRINKFFRGRVVEQKDEFYKEVSRLQDFVPSLLSLGDVDIEEAATTRLVQQVLDQIISRPFVVTVVFCDALFLAILIIGFRGAVNGVLLGSTPSSVLRYICLSNIGLFYFLIREAGKAISLCMITRRAHVYFWSFWNATDLCTTVLALISTVSIRSHLAAHAAATSTFDDADEGNSGIRNLIAITTGFMWLKCVNYVKGLNVKLATFVLAILQIARDILWFCFILFLLVVAASQMFFTLLAPQECRTSAEMRESRECQPSEYYLKVYAILLGDFGLFDRESFTSVFSIVLACFFTFLVVLLVSNIIIAASCDSWDLIRIRSHKLFGRARVMMIAELVSFQKLLRRDAKQQEQSRELIQSWWSSDSWAQGWSRGSLVFFSLSLGAVITWTIGEIYGYLADDCNGKLGNILMRLAPVYVNVGLFIGIMLFLSKGVDSDDSDGGEGTHLTPWGSEWYGRYFQKAMVRILGSSSAGETSGRGTEHQWQGRLLFLRNEMSRITSETHQDYRMMQHSIDCLVQQSEARVQAEVSAIEKRLCDMSRESQAVRVDLNRFMKDVLEAVRSLETGDAQNF